MKGTLALLLIIAGPPAPSVEPFVCGPNEGVLDPATAEADAWAAVERGDRRFWRIDTATSCLPGLPGAACGSFPFGIGPRNLLQRWNSDWQQRQRDDTWRLAAEVGMRKLRGFSDYGPENDCPKPGDYGTYAEIYNQTVYKELTGRDLSRLKPPHFWLPRSTPLEDRAIGE